MIDFIGKAFESKDGQDRFAVYMINNFGYIPSDIQAYGAYGKHRFNTPFQWEVQDEYGTKRTIIRNDGFVINDGMAYHSDLLVKFMTEQALSDGMLLEDIEMGILANIQEIIRAQHEHVSAQRFKMYNNVQDVMSQFEDINKR